MARRISISLIAALWACAPPEPEPAASPTPEPMLTVAAGRITAAPVPPDDPAWAVGAYIEGYNPHAWLAGTLKITAVRDGVAHLRALAREPHTTLHGVVATPYAPGSPTLAAPVRSVDADRVGLRLDVGIRVDDRGIVLDGSGQPIGGVQVVSTQGAADTGAGSAHARLVFGRAQVGDDVRWLWSDEAALHPAVALRVVVAEDGRALADALDAERWDGFEFTSAAGLSGQPDAAAVRAFGRQRGADVVIHGPARCDTQTCRPPQLTPITPRAAELLGRFCVPEHPACPPQPTLDPAAEPMPTATAADRVLAELARATRRHHGAEWHLRRALAADGFGATERAWAHLHLAEHATLAGSWARAADDLDAAQEQASDARTRLTIDRVRLSLAHSAHDWRAAETQARALVERARAAGDPLTEAFAHRTLGFFTPDLEAARDHFTLAAERSRAVGDDAGHADAIGGLAQRLDEAGRSAGAAALLTEEALPRVAAPADAALRAHLLTRLARAQAALGRLDEARRLLEDEVRPIHTRRGDPLALAGVVGELASIQWKAGERDEAHRTLHEEVLPAMRRLGPFGAEACWLEHIATLEIGHDWSAVLQGALAAAELYAQRGDTLAQARLLTVGGFAALSTGDPRAARRLHARAWPTLDAYGLTDEVLTAQLGLAQASALAYELRAAESMLRGWVIPGLSASDPHGLLGRAWATLGLVHTLREDYAGALVIYVEHALPTHAAALDHRGWAESAAEAAALLEKLGRVDEAITLWTDAMPSLTQSAPAVRIQHALALADALRLRGGPGDMAAAGALVDEARAIADGDDALLELIESHAAKTR